MPKTNDGGAAFPLDLEYVDSDGLEVAANMGMSLRDYFAAKAMQVVLAEKDKNKYTRATIALIATTSYLIADAMLEARKCQ